MIVRIQRQVVDYALRRRSLLADVYAGRVGVAEGLGASERAGDRMVAAMVPVEG